MEPRCRRNTSTGIDCSWRNSLTCADRIRIEFASVCEAVAERSAAAESASMVTTAVAGSSQRIRDGVEEFTALFRTRPHKMAKQIAFARLTPEAVADYPSNTTSELLIFQFRIWLRLDARKAASLTGQQRFALWKSEVVLANAAESGAWLTNSYLQLGWGGRFAARWHAAACAYVAGRAGDGTESVSIFSF